MFFSIQEVYGLPVPTWSPCFDLQIIIICVRCYVMQGAAYEMDYEMWSSTGSNFRSSFQSSWQGANGRKKKAAAQARAERAAAENKAKSSSKASSGSSAAGKKGKSSAADDARTRFVNRGTSGLEGIDLVRVVPSRKVIACLVLYSTCCSVSDFWTSAHFVLEQRIVCDVQ